MLKKARYRCYGAGLAGIPDFNYFVYYLDSRNCYFSGIENKNRSGTIIAAEDVIEAIAQNEGVPIWKYRYFDLQNRRGYSHYLPGQYQLDELILDCSLTGLYVKMWKPTPCPPYILEIFRQYIGHDLKLEEKFAGHNLRFSEGLLAVWNKKLEAYHIREDGTPTYNQRYDYVDDFKNGKAWVSNREHQWAQIDKNGRCLTPWLTAKELNQKGIQ